ncbi:MAG TPA: hypothetical protein DCZ95_12670 [Verrucomicrobia bacterium]|nr:hypothetical protein [Verrucomicrobiota bacterium]
MKATQLPIFEEVRPQSEIIDDLMREMRESINGPQVPETGGYVVVEMHPKPWCKFMKGMCTEPILWGLGDTAPAAVEDAVQWVTTSEGQDEIQDKEDLLCSGRFTIFPCSKKLAEMVHRYGGEIDFEVHDGRVVLPRECAGRAALRANG